MSWKVRHEGSPQWTEGLTLDELTRGLRDGRWEPTDEVWGPDDHDWVAFENHPQFAEAAAELEPPPPRVYDDETRLDMTALIDVTMVLLIFFILTTTYGTLQKLIEAASVTSEKAGDKIRLVKEEEIEESMVKVEARVGKNGQTILKVEGAEVKPEDLLGKLREYSSGAKRRKVLLDHDAKVPHGVIVAIQDDARSAQMDEVLFVLP